VTQTTNCYYCGKPMTWFACPCPFWLHDGATAQHGDWVPDHDCAADWSRRSDTDVPNDCGGQP
jgi:hypothetical protein